MRKEELGALLTRRLRLAEPRFKLRRSEGRLSGSVVSDTFKGKTDSARQQMIWDALDAEFGAGSVHQVGMLLAYTPDEWDVDLPAAPKPLKAKAG